MLSTPAKDKDKDKDKEKKPQLSLFKKIDELKVDIEKLGDAYRDFVSTFKFNEINQLNLTRRPDEAGSPYEGIGSLYDFEKRTWKGRDMEYSELIPAAKGTYFEEIFDKLKSHSKFKIGRARLMNLEPKRCYSVHQDETYRLHYAITTNPQCFMSFINLGGNQPKDEVTSTLTSKFGALMTQIPADGYPYFTNTTCPHTAFNGGNTNRVHLVFSLAL